MDIVFTLKDFVQSRVLERCRTNNPLIDGISSALILSLCAWLSYYVRHTICRTWTSIIKILDASGSNNNIEIEEYSAGYGMNHAYLDFCWYITHEHKCQKGSLRVVQYQKRYDDDESDDRDKITSFLVPQEDVLHSLVYDNNVISYKFYKHERENRADKKGLYLYTKNKDCEILKRFLEQIKVMRMEWVDQSTWTQTIFSNKDASWNGMLTHNEKSLDTVVMHGDMLKRLQRDVEDFLKSEEWYKKMGIAYTRGYLLSGNPGVGKTSIIKAMSYKLRMDVYYLNLKAVKNDDDLKTLFDTIPIKSMLVMEDIDCMTEMTHARSKKPSKGILSVTASPTGPSLSCLLNSLDGLCPQHGRILVMTTNHPDRLDPALIRPGRCDMKISLPMCTSDIISKMYKMYYDKDLDPIDLESRSFERHTPAEISAIFIKHRYDAVAGYQELKETLDLEDISA